MAQVRIRGLVKAMNQVRDQLSVGLSPSEVEGMRRMVADTVAQVDAICREHNSTPAELPTPSRRAYEYLKALDFDHLMAKASQPRYRKTASKPKRTKGVRRQVRVKNLISLCHWFHDAFADLARGREGGRVRWEASNPEVVKLTRRLRAEVDKVDTLCQEAEVQPAELPVRSRRAYQWMKFLCDPEQLSAHLTTLSMAMNVTRLRPSSSPETGGPGGANSESLRQRMPRELGGVSGLHRLPIRVEFYFTSALYSTRVRPDEIRIVAHEAFVGAPYAVIRSLMWTALRADHAASDASAEAHAARVKAYAADDAFADVLLELELNVTLSPDDTFADVASDTRGRYFDLAEVFERVNAEYFDGKMQRPRLTWNQTITHRKFGHYQPTTDTLMLSITLDQEEVPAYAIEFVMYHELLHKQLGVDVVNGRRYAHTSKFRERERAFQHYEQAQASLAQLSRAVRSGR
jgi:hypothetical protein